MNRKATASLARLEPMKNCAYSQFSLYAVAGTEMMVTALISVARYGRLQRGLTIPQLRDVIAGREPRTTGEHPVLQLRA